MITNIKKTETYLSDKSKYRHNKLFYKADFIKLKPLSKQVGLFHFFSKNNTNTVFSLKEPLKLLAGLTFKSKIQQISYSNKYLHDPVISNVNNY